MDDLSQKMLMEVWEGVKPGLGLLLAVLALKLLATWAWATWRKIQRALDKP